MQRDQANAEEKLESELARFEEVCRLGQDRLEPLADTIAAAFADDPIWKWIYHGGDATLEHERALVLARWLVAEMSPVDEIHAFRHHQAVALWHAPLTAANVAIVDRHRESTNAHGEAFGATLGARFEAIAPLTAAMREHRPPEPHWYLGIIATHPSRQGAGLGGRLLAAMHARSDRLGIPCYLESSNPQNHGLYRRHGYIEVGEFNAADSPPLMGFLRAPR